MNFQVYNIISMTIAQGVSTIWNPFEQLPVELQYKCSLYFPRDVYLHVFENKSTPKCLVDKEEQVIVLNTSFLLRYLKQYPGIAEEEEKVWNVLCIDPFGNQDFCIRYVVHRKHHVEKRHSEAWNEYYGTLECRAFDFTQIYEKMNYWNSSFLNFFVSRLVPKDHEFFEGGYMD